MRRVSRQYEDAAWRICLQLLRLELVADADVEHTGDDGVDPVLRMHVRHYLGVCGDLDAHNKRARLLRITYENRKADGFGERREGPPLHVLSQHFADCVGGYALRDRRIDCHEAQSQEKQSSHAIHSLFPFGSKFFSLRDDVVSFGRTRIQSRQSAVTKIQVTAR